MKVFVHVFACVMRPFERVPDDVLWTVLGIMWAAAILIGTGTIPLP
jgi:hypothetical protein